MAYDNVNRRLYVDKESDKGGIALWQIADCLRYYRRDKNGNRNLGTIIKNADINKWAKNKSFRHPNVNFDTEEERDAARKEAHQGLAMPTAVNAANIEASDADAYTYLNMLVYQMLHVGGVPNWDYLRPRGLATYNEPYRVLDFDGYDHKAEQPFSTYCSKGVANGSLTQLPPAGETAVSVNRFVTDRLRFSLVMGSNNVDISLADLLYGTVADFYFFVAEKYSDTNVTPYYGQRPSLILKASESVADVPQNGGSSVIDYSLVASDDNKQMTFILGVNEYTSNADDASLMGNGNGFIAPLNHPSNVPFLYTIRQEYYGVLDIRHLDGYYLPSLNGGFVSFSLKDYDDLTMKGTESDKVGISLNFRRRADNYYVIGSNPYTVPEGKVSYKFRLVNQKTGVTVVGTLSSADMMSDVSGNHVMIPMGGDDEWTTVYLRFDNFLPNSGDSVEYAILEVSTDNGTTWTQISASAMGNGYIEPGCDGSSIKLYLTRK